jgi:hypothetical protein
VQNASDINDQGRFELGEGILSTNAAMKGVNLTIPSPCLGAIGIPRNPPEDGTPIVGPSLYSSSDLDSFSVISDVDVEGPRILQLTDGTGVLTPANVLDSPTNASDHLLSLVQRYHSVCHTIDTLRDGINKRAEGMKQNALAKFELAKMQREMSREKAQEIIEGMRKASDRRVNVRLPWVPLEDGLVLLSHRDTTKTPEKYQIAQRNPFRLSHPLLFQP